MVGSQVLLCTGEPRLKNWELGWLIRWLFEDSSKFGTRGWLPIRLQMTFWPWTQKLSVWMFDGCSKFDSTSY